MTAGAGTAGKGNGLLLAVSYERLGSTESCTYGTGVDGQTVVLVLDVGTSDGDLSAVTDIETVSVGSTTRITSRIVDSDVSQGEISRAVNAKDLNRGILDGDSSDGRRLQAVSVEELGLGLSAVGSLAIPPSASLTVEDRTRGTSHGDVCPGDGNKRTCPLRVAKGSGAFKGNVSTRGQTGEVQSRSRRYCHGGDDDGGAACFGLAGRRGSS